MVGIFALMDPLRDGIKEAITTCHKAGITVRMCTGDSLDTATAISIAAGIITEEELTNDTTGYICMVGQQFREAVDNKRELIDPDTKQRKESVGNMHVFRKIAAKLKVLARSTPEDKYLLVMGLKEMNHIVAVTGDGTNDAPALHKADIGFAMGSGTDVAKNASKIVLTDDNFCSILIAVLYGRNIFDSVRKFL